MIEVSPQSLSDHLGEEIAVSDTITVTQQRIDQFSEAIDDRQWIHTDPVRAAAESPYGGTIAHGFLTLSLVSALSRLAMTVVGVRMAVNYGLNRVRFISAVTAGSRIRARFVPTSVEPIGDGRKTTWRVTIELADTGQACCVAEWIICYYLLLDP